MSSDEPRRRRVAVHANHDVAALHDVSLEHNAVLDVQRLLHRAAAGTIDNRVTSLGGKEKFKMVAARQLVAVVCDAFCTKTESFFVINYVLGGFFYRFILLCY